MANVRTQSYVERAREAAANAEWALAEGFARQAAADLPTDLAAHAGR